MSEKKKRIWALSSLGCLIAGTSCGVPFIPGVWGTKLPGVPYPRFVLGSSEFGQELHIPIQEDLIKQMEKESSIPLSQTNIKWGFRSLKEQDALISSCKDDNTFYVGAHKWGSEYQLHNGKKFFLTRENCCCNGDNSEPAWGKPIKLNSSFKQTNNGVESSGTTSTSKLILVSNTCTFTLNKENGQANSNKWNLKMDCEGYANVTGGSGGSDSGGARCEKKNFSLTIDSNNYKPRYIQKINQLTHK